VTVAGRFATAGLLLESVTTAPAGAAPPVKVTVATELLLPSTIVGLSVSEARAAGCTVSVVVFVTLPKFAEIFTAVLLLTICVVMEADPDDSPLATVNQSRSVSAAFLPASLTPAGG
jgi:hypothetical protein